MLSFWRARLFVLTAMLALCCSLAPAWALVCDCAPRPAMVCERPCGNCCHRYPVPSNLEQRDPAVLRATAVLTARTVTPAAQPGVLPAAPAFPEVQLLDTGVTYRETELRPPRLVLGPSLACRAPPVPL